MDIDKDGEMKRVNENKINKRLRNEDRNGRTMGMKKEGIKRVLSQEKKIGEKTKTNRRRQ